MNIDYLVNEVIPQREKEIEEGLDAGTRQPIYFIYDIDKVYTTVDNEFSNLDDMNEYGLRAKTGRLVYFDEDGNEVEDGDELEFIEDRDGDVTEFYKDRYIALFLTRKDAEEYLEYQSHNLSSKAYIYVHYTGYSNHHMDKLLENK